MPNPIDFGEWAECMRSQIRKKLYTEMNSLMAVNLPEFHPFLDPQSSPDEAIWAKKINESLIGFFMVSVANDHDDFTIEAAWADGAFYPWEDYCFKFRDLRAKRGRGGLSFLWVPDGIEYRWQIVRRQSIEDLRAKSAARKSGNHELARELVERRKGTLEEAVSRVRPLAEDAVKKMVEYGIPLLKAVVAKQGG